MQILIDNPEIKKELIRIRTHAVNNIFDFTNGIPENHRPAGDNPNHVFINGTLKVVYSVEKQNMKHKKQNETKLAYLHHLSISTLNRKLPHPEMVNSVLKMFNMTSLNDEVKIRKIYIEDKDSVNIIEVMEFN